MATEPPVDTRASLDSRATSSADNYEDAHSQVGDDASEPETPIPGSREATPRPAPYRFSFLADDDAELPQRRRTVIGPRDAVDNSETTLNATPAPIEGDSAPTERAGRSPSPRASRTPSQAPSRTPSQASRFFEKQFYRQSQVHTDAYQSTSSLGSHHDRGTHIEQEFPFAVEPTDPPEKEREESSSEEVVEETPVEDTTNHASGVRLYLLTLGLFLATFVIALDNTIIATAIPKITTDFSSINDVGWYGSSYLLTTTSLQPSFGKIYSYFNVKYVYMIALVLFEAGSVVCATAPNSVALIIGRALAGVGAAALFSGGMTIVGYSVPLRRRALYIAILSSTFGIASVVGPILGGIFTDNAKLTWRFCFWINLPVGGLALLTTFFFFTSPKRKGSNLTFGEKIRKMDLGGAGVLICAIVCLLLALQWGGITYGWKDSRVWGCLLGFGLLISVFIALQLWVGDDATIPARIISQRAVAVGVTFTVFLSMALFAHIYYLPFYFQAVKGTTAEGSGIRTIPYLVSNTLASIVVGAAVTVFGPYTPFLWLGSAVFTVGAGLLYTLGVDDGAARWIGWQLVAGIGAGFSVQIPFISVQCVLPAADMPTGNALTIFFNTLGGALSVSICQNIFSNKLVEDLQKTVPPLVLQIVQFVGATNIQKAVPSEYLPAVLDAYDRAVTRAFLVPIAAGGIAFLVSLFMPWGSVKGKKLMMGGA